MIARELTADRYSDAMDSAVTSYCVAGRLSTSISGEGIVRDKLAAAFVAFIREIPQSDLARLARPPDGNGTTVGAQPVAQMKMLTVITTAGIQSTVIVDCALADAAYATILKAMSEYEPYGNDREKIVSIDVGDSVSSYRLDALCSVTLEDRN